MAMDGEHLKEVAARALALAENVEGLNSGEQLMAWLGEAKGWVERFFPGGAIDLSIMRALDANELGTLMAAAQALRQKFAGTSVARDIFSARDQLRSVAASIELACRRLGRGGQSEVSSVPSVTPASDSRFEIAILCALHKPELEKVRSIGQWDELAAEPDDPSSYLTSTYRTKKGKDLHVVAATPTQMGMPASAVLATKMIRRFRPKLVAMVGIAAGVKSEAQGFGDILAPDSTFDYGAGKVTSHDGKLHFKPDPNAIPILPRLRNRLKHWSSKRTHLDDITARWSAALPRTSLALHVGPLGSGAQVLDTRQPIEDVRDHWRKLIGVEMEAYGVHIACQEAVDPAPMFLCMKSICDFAADKKDDWQDYAAFTAAELCHRFLIEEWETLFPEPANSR